MLAPKNVSDLKSFPGQLQFYRKFLQNLSSVVETLFRQPERTFHGDGEQRKKQLSKNYSM